jgi:hypothetical protein
VPSDRDLNAESPHPHVKREVGANNNRKLAGLLWRTGASRLSIVGNGHHRPCTAGAELLRDDLVLVACPVSGVFLRSNDGELSARHVHAFTSLQVSTRVPLYDKLKSAVLERRGSLVHFNPRLLELAGHHHFEPRPCQVRAGNQKDQTSYCTPLKRAGLDALASG